MSAMHVQVYPREYVCMPTKKLLEEELLSNVNQKLSSLCP